MKLFRSACLLPIIGIALVSNSCTTQENVSPQEVPILESEIFEKEGRLVFKDVEVYEETRLMLRDNPEFQESWEKQFPNFTSMRAAYDNISELQWDRIYDNASNEGFENLVKLVWGEDREFVPERVVPLNYVATMVNHHGLVQIGDELYKYTQDYLLVGDISQEGLVNKWVNIYEKDQLGDNHKVKILPFNFKYLPSDGTTLLVERAELNGRTNCEKRFNSKLRRVRGTIRMGFLYSGGRPYEVVWANTYYEKRKNRFSRWRRQNVNRICVRSQFGRARIRVSSTGTFFYRDIIPFEECHIETSAIEGVIFETTPGTGQEIVDWGNPRDLGVEHTVRFTNGSGAVTGSHACNTTAHGVNR